MSRKILLFGYDTSLLEKTDNLNECQFRQLNYCNELSQKRFFLILCSNPGPSYAKISDGVLQGWRVNHTRTIFRLLRAYRLGVRIAKEYKPDLIEYQDPSEAGLVAMLVSIRTRTPLVGGLFNDLVDNTNWINKSLRRKIWNSLAKKILTQSLAVRCDSIETTLRLSSSQKTGNIHYIPFLIPWIDEFKTSPSDIASRLASWEAEPRVLCVARFAEEKNIPMLIDAFAKARKKSGRGRLILVGDGPEEKRIKDLAENLGIRSAIDFLGAVAYRELPQLFKSSHIFALSSDSETSARVLILAQRARLPTISTRTSGADLIITNQETGYIVPIRSVSDFCNQLTVLMTNREIYKKFLYSKSFNRSESYSTSSLMSQMKQFYENCSTPNRDTSNA